MVELNEIKSLLSQFNGSMTLGLCGSFPPDWEGMEMRNAIPVSHVSSTTP